MRFRLLLTGFALFALVRFQAAHAAAAGFEWQEPADDHIDLLYDGRPALRLMKPTLDESSEDKRLATMKPFHHVYSPDGKTLLTKGEATGLYPHHKGVFYGFNKITYGDGKSCDTWHCQGKAFQSAEKVLSQEARGKAARHRVAIDWHGQDGEVFAHEEREVTVRRQMHNGVEGWRIDFDSHLATADGKPIHLDGDPQHAGFHFRAAQEVADQKPPNTYYLRTDGKGKEGGTINWDPAKPNSADNKRAENRPWNAMSIILGGQRYTILYLDHPQNPKPARYSEREYGRFGSYFVTKVTKDKPLDVKYRLWVQPGEMTVDQCEKLHHDFIN